MAESKITLIKPSEPTTSMSLKDYEESLRHSYDKGLDDGRRKAVYYFHIVLQGLLRPEHFEREDMDEKTWDKTREILTKLSGMGGH